MLDFVLLTDSGSGIEDDGVFEIERLLKQSDPDYQIEPSDPADFALLHFTSGTTGTPKCVMHVHAAIAHHL